MGSAINVASFSLTDCGPVDRMLTRAGMKGAGSPRLLARAFIPALIVWIPLLLLALFLPHEGEAATVTFLNDLSTHVRFLVVVPLLVLAEAVIGRRTGVVAMQFLDAGLIGPEDRPQFDAVLSKSRRALDSAFAEVIILALAVAFVYSAIRALTGDGFLFWFEEASSGREGLALAGWWYAAGSLIPPFLFLRWAWRYAVWCAFLFRMSQMNLRIVASHPDQSAGLGFVALGHAAFAQVGFAASCMVAAAIGTAILQEGAQLMSFKWPLLVFVAISIAVGILPLLVFWRPLQRVKEQALLNYGKFASGYVQEFERKWISSESQKDLMAAADDIQALADLGGGFERVAKMRLLPLVLQSAIAIAAAAATPMLPLVLTVIPLQELLKLLVQSLI